MNQFSIDILLEFLYNKFATTFAFCLFGSIVREYLTANKTDSNGKNIGNFNLGKVVISAIFSTILMCACADYVNVDLHIEVYAIISVVLGMWGLGIMKGILDKKFLNNFFKIVSKVISNPLIKSAVESASVTLEQESKELEKKQPAKDETENKKE
jgi:hypothetical protein